MKFEIKGLKEGRVYLCEKSHHNCLIDLGKIVLCKENKKNNSYCHQFENNFNYHGIKKALCGKTWINGNVFKPKRILVIQMQ